MLRKESKYVKRSFILSSIYVGLDSSRKNSSVFVFTYLLSLVFLTLFSPRNKSEKEERNKTEILGWTAVRQKECKRQQDRCPKQGWGR